MRLGGILAALLGALLGATARATTCLDAETQQTDDLYVAAANTAACSQYAAVLPWSVMIWWSCDNDACVAVMRQLAQDLPDCEDATGVSFKTDLESSIAGCGGGTSTGTSSSGSTATATPTATTTEAPTATTEAPTATTEAPVSASTSASGSGPESNSIIIATTAPPASSKSSASAAASSSSSTASGSQLRSGDPASSASSSNSGTIQAMVTDAALALAAATAMVLAI